MALHLALRIRAAVNERPRRAVEEVAGDWNEAPPRRADLGGRGRRHHRLGGRATAWIKRIRDGIVERASDGPGPAGMGRESEVRHLARGHVMEPEARTLSVLP